MNYAAIILQPDHPSAFTKVYGLLVMERTFHALERAGVDSVLLPYTEEERLQEIIDRKKDWKINFKFTDNFKGSYEEIEKGLLVLSGPLVVDVQVLQNLISDDQASDKVVVANDHAACFPIEIISKLKSVPRTFEDWIGATERLGHTSEKIDIGKLPCQPVLDKAAKKEVKKKLIKSLTKPTDGWVSKNLNRPISTSFSRVLAHTPITPNQFTIITGFIGLLTGVFLALGGYWNYLIGGALFHFTSVLDGVDGELARLKFKSSPFGQWLDTLVDNLSYLAALAGIIIGVYRNGASPFVLYSGGLAALFVIFALGSLYFYLLRFKSGGTLLNVEYSFQNGTGFFDRFMQIAALFGKRDLFALIFFGLGIIGQMPLALTYIAIMAFFVFVFSVQAHFSASKKRKLEA